MSAIGGKADTSLCAARLLLTQSGHVAFGKGEFGRGCRLPREFKRTIQESMILLIISPFSLSHEVQAQVGRTTCCRHSKRPKQNRVHPRRLRNQPKVL